MTIKEIRQQANQLKIDEFFDIDELPECPTTSIPYIWVSYYMGKLQRYNWRRDVMCSAVPDGHVRVTCVAIWKAVI